MMRIMGTQYLIRRIWQSKIIKYCVPIIYILFFLVTGCFAQSALAPKDKSFVSQGKAVDEYTWDFGDVKKGVILKHDFVFKNDTGKPLNIKDLNTSCGCTVSKVEKKALLDGEFTNIEVKFNSAKYSGAVTQFIYLNTDNLDNPLVKYTIKANVN